MLASPRGLSQLATSFIALSRLGILTHALSSLTIKFTLSIEPLRLRFQQIVLLDSNFGALGHHPRVAAAAMACNLQLPVNIQFSKITMPADANARAIRAFRNPESTHRSWWNFRFGWWAWVDSNYRPHPYQGCALTT